MTESTRKQLRVGLVGIGNQCQEILIPSIQQCECADIVAVCDIDKSKARNVAHHLCLEDIYISYFDMLENEHLDAVVVSSTPSVHFLVAKAALERSLPVFVEKPPTSSLDELNTLIALADDKHTLTSVGMNFRYSDPIKRLKASVLKQELGQPICISIHHFCNKPTLPIWNEMSLSRSYLLAQTIHSIDLLLFLSGSVPRQHFAYCYYQSPTILLNVGIIFENGTIGTLVTGNTSPHFIFDIEVITQRLETITINDLWEMSVTFPTGSAELIGKNKGWRFNWNPSPLNSGYSRAGYANELASFFNCIFQQVPSISSFSKLKPTYQLLEQLDSFLQMNAI
jgi:phthalate 4,5-cis-dihydrodiol dehydrogenase